MPSTAFPEAKTKTGKRVFVSELFENWITRRLGLAQSPLRSLESDDDWSFVIKMYAILEAALNHLLKVRLNDPKLIKIVTKLPTNDERRGKLALIKTYDLLREDCRLFVQLFSKIRNTAVHDAKSFGLDLTKYVTAIKDKEKREWKKAFSSWWVLGFPDPQHPAAAQHEAAGRYHFETALDDPRLSIFRSCTHILAQAQVHEMNAERRRREPIQAKLAAAGLADRVKITFTDDADGFQSKGPTFSGSEEDVAKAIEVFFRRD
ncbi:MAG: hypothetical protein WA269_08015 [Candidatus Udaeobacter sp.]